MLPLLVLLGASPGDWLVWGGPNRNFVSPSTGLASSWPATGPKELWRRKLGDGYSSIAVENGILYTGYRNLATDVFTAIDAKTGKTMWESEVRAPFSNAWSAGVGPGPYAMPQIVGDRLFTASGEGTVQALDKRTGKVVWSRNLIREFGGTAVEFGYSCQALPYRDTMIYLIGGKSGAAMALRQSDGSIVWRSLDFTNAHASPLLINVDGMDQVVALTANLVIGFRPDTGAKIWSAEHKTEMGLAVATPVFGPGNLLFVSSAYGAGAKGFRVSRDGVEEVWRHPKVQSHFGNGVRIGDYVYLSSGHNGPAFLMGVEMKSGRVTWMVRDFAKSQLVYADNKLIILDADGNLGLASATPEKFQQLAKFPAMKSTSWTLPTLSGTVLYVRDRTELAAFDLGITDSSRTVRPASRPSTKTAPARRTTK